VKGDFIEINNTAEGDLQSLTIYGTALFFMKPFLMQSTAHSDITNVINDVVLNVHYTLMPISKWRVWRICDDLSAYVGLRNIIIYQQILWKVNV